MKAVTIMEGMTVRLIQTAKDTADRLAEKASLTFQPDEKGTENHLINIYDDVRYQTVIGFGGALTEASSVTIDRMGEGNRQEIVQAYFGQETGLGYTFCRTHINSCDFSLGNYAYVEEKDPELKKLRYFPGQTIADSADPQGTGDGGLGL